MSDEPRIVDRLDAGDPHDDFLRVRYDRGMDWVAKSPEASQPSWFRVRCRELRGGGYPRVRSFIAAVSRCVPSSFFRFTLGRMDHGSIWDQEDSRSPGPSDTAEFGLSCVRERDIEIGFRALTALTPLSLLVALLVMLFAVVRLAPIAPAHDNSHKEYATPPATKSGAIPAVLDSGRIIATTSTTTYVTDW